VAGSIVTSAWPGSSSACVNASTIYALHELALEEEKYRQQIVQTLIYPLFNLDLDLFALDLDLFALNKTD
jgi:hypothetical protein